MKNKSKVKSRKEEPGVKYTPGSNEAVDRGCICAQSDNDYGAGFPYGGSTEMCYWITGGCPLHAPDTKEAKSTTDPMEWRNTYSDQVDCCANCSHAFCREEYDEENEYYCMHGAGLRPPCGSCYMKEGFHQGITNRLSIEGSKQYMARRKVWKEWADGRLVAPWGRCDKHKQRKIKEA